MNSKKEQSMVKTLENLMVDIKKMTRREFMQRSAALGLGLTVAGNLWTRTVEASTPKRGGHLKVGMGHGSTTDSYDPATVENFFQSFHNFARHNHVGEVDYDGKMIPELCESWEPSPDARTWHFKIRKGVEFHNGKTIDADDFIASINHHRHKDSKSPAKELLKPVTEIKKDGMDAFSITLDAGNAGFPYIISDYHISIMQKKGDGVDWQSGIGAGGYQVEMFEPGVVARLKRFPNYWKEGKANFDSVEIMTIPDTSSRTTALKTKSIHLMDRCDLKTIHLLKRTPGIRIENVTGTAHYSMPMNTKIAPFDNNDVRMALKHAIDREAILKTILRGYGAVGNDHPISPANEFHASEIPQRKYDPEKANYHLKKAGLGKLKVELSAADAAFAGAVDAAILAKEHAAEAGIEIEVKRVPDDGYWSAIWRKAPWCMCYWGGRPTEDWMFSTAYAAEAAWNDTYWKHDRFNELLIQGRAELDSKKRRAIYVEMQQICRDEGATLVPLFNNYVFACTDKLQHGPNLAGNWDLDGHKVHERWWFA